MGFVRREFLALATAVGAVGCTAPTDTAESGTHEEAMTDRTPRHFNGNDELTSDVNNKLVRTDEPFIGVSQYIGAGDRPLVSNKNKKVTVPGDYDTIQAAVDDCPIFLRHQYIIDVDTGTYNEDVVVRQVHAGGPVDPTITGHTADEHAVLKIVGDDATPSNVEITSITAVNCSGWWTPTVQGVHIANYAPWDDESSGVIFYSVQLGQLFNAEFGGDGTGRAITSYASGGQFRDLDFGTDTRASGVTVKLDGTAKVYGGTVSGSLTDNVLVARNGRIDWNSSHVTATSTSDKVLTTGGRAYDVATGEMYGVESFPDKYVGASAYLSVAQTISATTEETILFDSTKFDDKGEFDTANNKFTVSQAGKYDVNAVAKLDSVADGSPVLIRIKVNGVEVAREEQSNSGGNNTSVSVSKVLDLATNDEITATLYNGDTTARDLNATDSHTFLTVQRA